MVDLSAKNSHDLLQQLKSIDISVPLIEQGRTTEHCERWSILSVPCHTYKTYQP